MRKVGFGIIWFLVLSFAVLFIGGMVIGGIAGAEDPANAEAAGRAAGEAFGQQYSGIIFLGALIAAVVGSWKGWLPGTKKPVEITE